MALGLRTIRVRMVGDSSGLDRTARNGQRQLSRWSESFRRFGAAAGVGLAAAGAAAVSLGRSAIVAASDLNETINKATVIFGDNAAAMRRWAGGAATSMGLSKNAALGAAASFGDMFQQIGFGADQSAKMSRKIVQLSADLGSFNNLPTADVSERIAAAFRGEFDSLQALIPNINAARVQKVALAQTGRENAEALTAQEKAAAVLSIVQKDGARAAGDFARTSGSLANQQKILQAQFENTKARLGTALLPIVTRFANFLTEKVVPAVDRFIRQMQNGSGAGGQFVDFMTRLAGAVKSTVMWIVRNRDVLIPLVAAYTSLVVTFKIMTAAQRAWNAIMAARVAITKAVTIAQRALNLAMRLNPIGIVITLIAALVAGIVIAYRRSSTFRKIVNGAFRAVKAVVLAVVNWFRHSFIPFFTKRIPAAFKAVIDWVKRNWPLILSILTGPIGAAVIFIVRNWDKIRDAAVRVFNALMRFFRGIPGRIKAAFSNAIRLLVTAGRDIINGLRNGIRAAMRGIKNWLRDHVWKPIVDAVRSLFIMTSPSQVFADFGRQMILGLIEGMIRTNPAKLVRQALGGISGVLGNLLGTLFPGGGGAPSANMKLGRAMAAAMGWTGANWAALRALWQGESGWNHLAENPTSGAYGIPQSLPASKMAAAGADWRTNPATQIKWGLNYIAGRYGSPLAAYRAWLSRSPHWYDQGGISTGPGFIAKATSQPERVLSPRQTEAFERLVDVLGDGAAMRPLVGELNLNHVPGYTTPQDLNRGLRHAELAGRYHRRG